MYLSNYRPWKPLVKGSEGRQYGILLTVKRKGENSGNDMMSIRTTRVIAYIKPYITF